MKKLSIFLIIMTSSILADAKNLSVSELFETLKFNSLGSQEFIPVIETRELEPDAWQVCELKKGFWKDSAKSDFMLQCSKKGGNISNKTIQDLVSDFPNIEIQSNEKYGDLEAKWKYDNVSCTLYVAGGEDILEFSCSMPRKA